MADVAVPEVRISSIEHSAGSHLGRGSDDGARSQRGKSPGGSMSLSDKLLRSLSGTPDGRRDSASHASFDPVTQTIIERTSAEAVTPQQARAQALAALDGRSTSDVGSPVRSSMDLLRGDGSHNGSVMKDKKRGASFLSRLRTGAKKRDSLQPDATQDDVEEGDETRAEGAQADVFSQPIGYIPKYPEPPKYIKVKARGKKEKSERSFDRLFVSQELRGRTGLEVAQAGGHRINVNAKAKHGNAIWAMEFSRDGRYLAAGGHGHIVRVWSVIGSESDRKEEERAEERDGVKLSAPVFKSRPVQEYEGHTASILALSWSKNNFLLSSSMDKTVRLWHVSRAECLCVFKHPDFVPTVQFHPQDDRFFLAGSLDSRLRLWSIPDKNVAYSVQVPDVITAIAFTPDGKTAMAGTLTGLCIFYDVEKLKEQTRMHVRSAHGKNAKGSKITGIQAINYPPTDPTGEVKLLITSNDSRIRVYNFRDKSLELKLKGNENTTSQIRAAFSEDARHIIAGSEDKKCYIWDMGRPDKDREKHPMEVFEAHNDVVTAAIFAPARTRQLLQASGDPVFEICNPPPVQLVSKDSQSTTGESLRSPEDEFDGANTPTGDPDLPAPPAPAGASSGYMARSSHPGGYIIITADVEGRIKCFRSDCAWKNRQRNNDNWDTASTFSKKVLHRSSSIATRASRHSASFRDSFSYPSNDRILSWRQSIDRAPVSTEGNSGSSYTSGLGRSPSVQQRLNGRSGSPRKTTGVLGPNPILNHGRRLSSFASYKSRDEPGTHPLSTSVTNTPALSAAGASAQSLNSITSSTSANGQNGAEISSNGSKVLKASDMNALGLSNNSRGSTATAPSGATRRNDSIPGAETGDETDDDPEACRGCGGESFKAVRSKGRGTRLECTSCGLALE